VPRCATATLRAIKERASARTTRVEAFIVEFPQLVVLKKGSGTSNLKSHLVLKHRSVALALWPETLPPNQPRLNTAAFGGWGGSFSHQWKTLITRPYRSCSWPSPGSARHQPACSAACGGGGAPSLPPHLAARQRPFCCCQPPLPAAKPLYDWADDRRPSWDMCRGLSAAPYVTVSFDGRTHRSVDFIGAMVHGAAVPAGDGPALAHRQALGLGLVARLADRRLPRPSRHPLWRRRLQLAVDPRLRRNASRVSEGPEPRTPRPSPPRPREFLPSAR
jgi:hypothetical protein